MGSGVILSMPGQAQLFLLSVCFGAVIGLLFDLFRILRKTLPHPAFLIQLEDLIFWLAVTGLMFYFLLNENFGEIRLFTLLGAALGAILYFYTLSRIIMKVSVTVIEFLKRVIGTAVRILLTPLRFLWRLTGPYVKKWTYFVKLRAGIALKKTLKEWFIIRKKI